MMRYRADLRSIAFVLTYYALVIYQWNWGPTRWYLALPLLMLTMAFSWFCAVITHNTLHSPVFTSRWMNKVFQVMLTCSYGFPVSEYVPGHNLSHHKFTQAPKDVMRTTKVDSGNNLLNMILFVPRVAFDVTGGNMRFVKTMKNTHRAWYRQFLIETSICWGEKLVLFALDWRKTLLYIVIPHLWAVWGITAVNYLQHDGCDQEHPVNHSRNFVGEIFNWFTFNNGFHGMHHEQPGLHWSLLREKHDELLHPTIHPELEQKSLLIYLVKAFFWPGKRVTYDGKPVIVSKSIDVVDWVPVRGESKDLGAEGLTAAT
ncbi:MAG: fatty acid desaturase [Deltaproteobacteria bacterium]|nr:fatty acid desaturase [Deltaproteobacteria bacterium]